MPQTQTRTRLECPNKAASTSEELGASESARFTVPAGDRGGLDQGPGPPGHRTHDVYGCHRLRRPRRRAGQVLGGPALEARGSDLRVQGLTGNYFAAAGSP